MINFEKHLHVNIYICVGVKVLPCLKAQSAYLCFNKNNTDGLKITYVK